MIDFIIDNLGSIVLLLLFVYVAGHVFYAIIYDLKNPPKPRQYTWRNVWPDYKSEWERGDATNVYVDLLDNDIRGKIVRQSDGLYLATMYNGDNKEFLFDFDATKWVEEYKPRIYK